MGDTMEDHGEIDAAALERARQLGHEPRYESGWAVAAWGIGLLLLVGLGLLVSYVTVRVLVGPSLTTRNAAPPHFQTRWTPTCKPIRN